MADQPKQTKAPKNAATGGRPASESTPLGRLQYTLDRACNFINDGTSSYARRARTAARAGVSKEIAVQGLAAMEAALKDARASVERAYSAPEKAAAPQSRVKLGA